MSNPLAAQVRPRLHRLQESAAVRARLALVPSGRTSARRTPFVVLVFAILAAGVVGLLMFNTQMQQASFHATALQQRATALAAERQSLDMELQRLRDPQQVALRARSLGMVTPANPAFVRLADGKIVGTPTASTVADGLRVRGYAATLPAALDPEPKVVRVVEPRRTGTASADPRTDGNRKREPKSEQAEKAEKSRSSSPASGGASPNSAAERDRKSAHQQQHDRP